MYINHHETLSTAVNVIERSISTICRALLAAVIFALTICLFVNVVIPIATAITPLVNEILVSLLLKIFGAYL